MVPSHNAYALAPIQVPLDCRVVDASVDDDAACIHLLDFDCHYKRSDRCTYRLGGRWNVAPAFSMSLEGDRRESTGEESPEHALNLRGSMRW